MKANSIAPMGAGDDQRPLVLLAIGLLVVLLHLCQFPPGKENAAEARKAPVVFAWLHDQSEGEGLYRLEAESSSPEKLQPLPNRLRSLFFQAVAVNQADQELLALLPGIGPVLADRIVKQRQRRGNFNSPRDLLAVSGIGPGKLAKIRNLLVFDK